MILVRVLQANIQMIGLFLSNIGITILEALEINHRHLKSRTGSEGIRSTGCIHISRQTGLSCATAWSLEW